MTEILLKVALNTINQTKPNMMHSILLKDIRLFLGILNQNRSKEIEK